MMSLNLVKTGPNIPQNNQRDRPATKQLTTDPTDPTDPTYSLSLQLNHMKTDDSNRFVFFCRCLTISLANLKRFVKYLVFYFNCWKWQMSRHYFGDCGRFWNTVSVTSMNISTFYRLFSHFFLQRWTWHQCQFESKLLINI